MEDAPHPPTAECPRCAEWSAFKERRLRRRLSTLAVVLVAAIGLPWKWTRPHGNVVGAEAASVFTASTVLNVGRWAEGRPEALELSDDGVLTLILPHATATRRVGRDGVAAVREILRNRDVNDLPGLVVGDPGGAAGVSMNGGPTKNRSARPVTLYWNVDGVRRRVYGDAEAPAAAPIQAVFADLDARFDVAAWRRELDLERPESRGSSPEKR
ncbi:MAG TPA: hypothetical protein VEI02_11715 [Planctomycetota bacterium]|nr:hypothetical protein [Planctomycetota bacterium]